MIARIDAHGMTVLAQERLEGLGAHQPPSASRSLGALAALGRARAAHHHAALADVLSEFAAAEVPSVVLKGAALGCLLYGAPARRPVGDLDLLVPAAGLPRATEALTRLAFAPVTPTIRPSDKHAVFVRQTVGATVVVELHRGLFPSTLPSPRPLDLLTREPVSFGVGGLVAYALRPEAMLWHLCAHLVGHVDVFTRLRLIWVADILGHAERNVDLIDWRWLGREAPIVASTLSLLDQVVPVSPALRARVGLGARTGPPRTLDFDGWPRSPVAEQRRRGKSLARIAADTLVPSAWWLRLRHGLAAGDSIARHRWIDHPWEVGRLVTRLVRERALQRSTA